MVGRRLKLRGRMGFLRNKRSSGDDAMFCVQKDGVLLVQVSSFHLRVSWWADTRLQELQGTTLHSRVKHSGFRALSLTHIFSQSLKQPIPSRVSMPFPFSLPRLCSSLLSSEPHLQPFWAGHNNHTHQVVQTFCSSGHSTSLHRSPATDHFHACPPTTSSGKTSRPNKK